MMKPTALTTVARVATLTALTLGVASSTSWGGSYATVPFGSAELFFELNNTDGDLGIHAEVDGTPTKRLTIRRPQSSRAIFAVATGGSLRRQGLSTLTFESAEPSFNDLPPQVFFARFPEGEYEIASRSLEAEDQASTVTITHVLPAPTHFNFPPLAPCDAPVVVTAPVTIDWDPVTTSHPSVGTAGPVTIGRYEIAIDAIEREDVSLKMDPPPDVTSFPVPAIFTDVPGVIRFEVLVKLADGNRTGETSCFEIQ